MFEHPCGVKASKLSLFMLALCKPVPQQYNLLEFTVLLQLKHVHAAIADDVGILQAKTQHGGATQVSTLTSAQITHSARLCTMHCDAGYLVHTKDSALQPELNVALGCS